MPCFRPHSSFSLVRLTLFLLGMTWSGAHFCGSCSELFAAQDDERFVARFQDGKALKHHEINDLFQENKEAQFKGERLFDPKNPIRMIRDTFARPARPTRGLELANGDIIPGEIVTHLPASADTPARFLVRLFDAPGDSPITPNQFAIREGEIRRIWNDQTNSESHQPGLAIALDGRRWQARAIRFAGGSAQLLTKEGISNVVWTDLARLDFLQVDVLSALQREGIWSDQPATVVRVKLNNGALITFPRNLAMKQDAKEFLARPSWSIAPLEFAFSQVAAYLFHAREELPLSLFVPQDVKQTAGLQTHSWQRNATPIGGLLRLGDWNHELGFAFHAPQEFTWDLPPGAETLQAKIGVPHLGKAGCVKCKIHRDNGTGPVLWESDFIRGGEPPVDVNVKLDNATRFALVIDMAHQGRPADADPFDIRDDLYWLDPVVKVRNSELPSSQKYFTYWIPALAGWEITAEQAAKFVLREAWIRERRICEASLVPKDKNGEAPPLELHREVTITPHNARLSVEVARGGEGTKGHFIHVLLDRDLAESTLNGDAKTISATLVHPDSREYSLGHLLGKKVELAIVVEPRGEKANEMLGLFINRLDLQPLVENVSANGKFLLPAIPLESLKPTKVNVNQEAKELPLAAGKTSSDAALEIRRIPFASGFAVPAGTQLTYSLDPTYARFVAVIGLAEGWQGAGPFSILLDDEPFWHDATRENYDRNAPGQQIDLAIPPGHQTITFQVGGKESEGAWAQAGFTRAK